MQIQHFFAILGKKKVNNLLTKAGIYQNYDRNETKSSSGYRIALLTEKKILKTLVRNATSAIAEVAEVAHCASNYA